MFSSERLKGIDVFVSVSEFGSFTAAAERMNLTASAISKSIARLEKRLGAQLFRRTTRKLSLTDAGVAFLRTCKGVLADLEEAELSLQCEDTEPRGRVRIDLPGAFGRAQVLPIILQFAKDHPLLVPHLSFSDGYIDPLQEGVDIALRIGSANAWPETIEHRLLAREWHIFCASREYLDRHGTPLSERDLEQHRCIAYGWVDGSISPWNFAGEQRSQVDPQLVVGNGDGLRMAALAGCGIVQLPSWLVEQELKDETLVQVLAPLACVGMEINLAWVKSRQALPKVRVLLDALVVGLSEPVSIRPAIRADIPELMAFLMQARAELFPKLSNTGTPADLLNFEAVYLKGEGRFLLARDQGRIVASIGYLPYDQRFQHLDYRGLKVVEVVRLFVLPEFRRSGLASKLYGALKALALQAGVEVIYLHTHPFLPGAIDFWRKRDFRVIAVDADPQWQTTHMEWRPLPLSAP